jgi:hypothetical protein
MAFAVNCTNKGCGKLTECMLDVKTNEVFCAECDKPISNITHFAKVQLKALGQIRKDKKENYSIKCDVCSRSARPILKDDKALCKFCSAELNVSRQFIIILKDFVKNADK